MTLFVSTLAFMLLVVLAMSLGVALTGRRLRGSCGGLSSGRCVCDEQGKPRPASCTRGEGGSPSPGADTVRLRRHRHDER